MEISEEWCGERKIEKVCTLCGEKVVFTYLDGKLMSEICMGGCYNLDINKKVSDKSLFNKILSVIV